MWDIEVNIAGFRFTHLADRRPPILGHIVRRVGRRPARLREHVRHLLAA